MQPRTTSAGRSRKVQLHAAPSLHDDDEHRASMPFSASAPPGYVPSASCREPSEPFSANTSMTGSFGGQHQKKLRAHFSEANLMKAEEDDNDALDGSSKRRHEDEHAAGDEEDDGAIPGAQTNVELVASAVVPTFIYLVKACGMAAKSLQQHQQQKSAAAKSMAPKLERRASETATADLKNAVADYERDHHHGASTADEQHKHQHQDSAVDDDGCTVIDPEARRRKLADPATHPYLRKLQKSLFPVMALALEDVLSNPQVLREALGDAESRAQEQLSMRGGGGAAGSVAAGGLSANTSSGSFSAGGLKRGASAGAAAASAKQKQQSPQSQHHSPASTSHSAGHSSHGAGHHHHHHQHPSQQSNSLTHQHSIALTRKQSFVSGALNLQDHTLEALAARERSRMMRRRGKKNKNKYDDDDSFDEDDDEYEESDEEEEDEEELTPEEKAELAERRKRRQEQVKKHRWFVFRSLAESMRKVKGKLEL